MPRLRLTGNLIVLLLIGFALIGCGSAPPTAGNAPEISHPLSTPDDSQETESRNHYPIIEIWKDIRGSVTIPGASLYFRLYDDGTVEFEYELRKDNESGKPRSTYSTEKATPAKISEERLRNLQSLLENLAESKGVKQEYQRVGLTFDVITKLTVLIKGKDTVRRTIIINDSEYTVTDRRFEKKFPKPLVDLFKDIALIRAGL